MRGGRRSPRAGTPRQRRKEDFEGGPGPRQIVEELRKPNVIGGTQLASDDQSDERRAVGRFHQKTNSTDDRVLSSGEADVNRAAGPNHIKRKSVKEEHGDDGFLIGRHFPMENGNRRVPAGVKVFFAEVEGSLSLSRTTGKIGRSRLEGRMNADGIFRDGTMPVSVLASKPWPSGTAFAAHGRRISELEKRMKNVERKVK